MTLAPRRHPTRHGEGAMDAMHARCAGLDVHKDVVVACMRVSAGRRVSQEVEQFSTTTRGLLALREWLERHGCTHAAMEATGVYWKPVWDVLGGVGGGGWGPHGAHH